MTDLSWVLDSSPTAARQARGLVNGALRAHGCVEDTLDTAALLTSELVTNAVRHTSGPLLDLGLHIDAAVATVAVGDHSQALPEQVSAAPTDDSGRGLSIVDALAVSWGVTLSERGKEVWFQLALG